MTLWLMAVVIFALITLAALLSASETALLSSSRPRIHLLMKKGNQRAAIVDKLQDRLDAVISAIIMGNTLLHILSSALVTATLVTAIGEVGVVYATVGMTLFILLYAEVMPKILAVRHPDATALWLAPFLRVFMWVLRPFARFIQWLAQMIWLLVGVDLKAPKASHESEENLRGAIDLHRGHEPEIEEERRMLKSILELDDIMVDEVLVHRKDVVTLDINLPTSQLVEAILSNPYTRYPVWENNPENIIGLLHARDVLKALQKRSTEPAGSGAFSLASLVMPPWFIPESTTLFHQLQAFRSRHEHMALVIDEYGAFQGIITLEDILEEIVGEITDEHDPEHSFATSLGDGSFEVRGHTTIRDLNRHFEWDLSDQEATTLAGLVLYSVKRIPKVGQEIDSGGFKFLILERHRNQLTRIKVTPPPPSD